MSLLIFKRVYSDFIGSSEGVGAICHCIDVFNFNIFYHHYCLSTCHIMHCRVLVFVILEYLLFDGFVVFYKPRCVVLQSDVPAVNVLSLLFLFI